jgi:5-deoxy-5-amino-3-dehydroquinate synthase
MRTVPVELGSRRYDVVVGEGARHELASIVAERLGGTVRRAAVVSQSPIVEAGWLEDLDPGVPFDVHLVPDGEGAKSLATIEDLCRAMARSGLSRADVIVAVGGGVVTDLAGFAAAAYHRGTPVVTVATTLLAQVDAAIGGKTGVNLPEGKNLVGAFWQPSGVLCDLQVLSSLPPREWACGKGEIAKYVFLTSGGPDMAMVDRPLEEQVAQCVELKSAVVAADERETELRMVLNYGHTLAHAVEAWALDHPLERPATDIRHGEAVAVGLVFAALLARRLGRIDDRRVALHRQVIEAFGLCPDLPVGVTAAQLLDAMSRDKKAHHELTFVLDGPRGVEPVRGVESGDVLATLAQMGAA